MKKSLFGLLPGVMLAFSTHAATSQFLEDFEGGKADWLDADHNDTLTHHASGGHDGGAYISITADIDTTVGGFMGGWNIMDCAQFTNDAPTQDCSGGGFVGNWYFEEGVQIVRYWFRHNSTRVGGLDPTFRVTTTFNTPGASALPAAVPANTWTQITMPVDLQDPIWDKQWGALVPDGVKIFRQVNRLQPGYFFDPAGPDYSETGVTFDIDDVEILGSTSIDAVVDIIQSGGQHGHGHAHRTLHLHHDGSPTLDYARVMVFGASTGAGDPEDLETDDIDVSTVRIGRLGGPNISGQQIYNLDHDSDGLDDVEFAGSVLTSFGDGGNGPTGSCQASWAHPTAIELRAELTTGEVIAGKDETFSKTCIAACHVDP